MMILTLWHRPGAVLDYLFEPFTLEEGETIVGKSVTIETAGTLTDDGGMIVDVTDPTTGAVTTAGGVLVWVSGGALGDTGRVLCTATTSAGRTDTLALDLNVGYYP